MDRDGQPKSQLPNRPQEKLPPLSKGSRIQKRPLPRRHHAALAPDSVAVDPDGYKTPAGSSSGRAPPCVYVSAKTPFKAVVKRVRKALENGPQKTKGLSLTARVAALSTAGAASRGDGEASRGDGRGGGNTRAGGNSNNSNGAGSGDEVVVIGTGRAIEKTLNVAAWFDRQRDCKVSLRTRSVGAVDDVVIEAEDREEEEEQARVRMVSCLEVVVTPC